MGRTDQKVDSYFTLNFAELQDEGLTLMIRATRSRSSRPNHMLCPFEDKKIAKIAKIKTILGSALFGRRLLGGFLGGFGKDLGKIFGKIMISNLFIPIPMMQG